MERSNDSHLHFILVLQCNQQRRVSQGRCKTCGAWNWSLYLQVQYSPFLKTKISIVHVRMSVYLYIMYTARRGTHTRTLSSFFLSFASIQQQKVCYEERRIELVLFPLSSLFEYCTDTRPFYAYCVLKVAFLIYVFFPSVLNCLSNLILMLCVPTLQSFTHKLYTIISKFTIIQH